MPSTNANTNNGTAGGSALFSWSPLAWGLWAAVTFAALFEPLRIVLLHSPQDAIEVGGIGGVGGLANLSGPNRTDDAVCANGFQDKYCYVKGSIGPFTPFAVFSLALWVGPLVLACVAVVLMASPTSTSTSTPTTTPTRNNNNSYGMEWLGPIWLGLNLLWFLVPLTTFGLGLKEFSSSFTKGVLALGLAAAHPLSWNLSWVLIPTGGIVSKLVAAANSPKSDPANQWFAFHRLLGYTTAMWGILHGTCEFVYLLQSKERLRKSLWNIARNGEDFLYWCGVLCFVLLSCHAVISVARKTLFRDGALFRKVHHAIAASLLLIAAAHWWPFALFFVPTTAIHGISLADNAYHVWKAQRSTATPPHPQLSPTPLERLTTGQAAVWLGVSLVASLAGLTLVWMARDAYMSQPTANLSIPFVFPPLSVVASVSASFLVAIGLMVGSESLAHPPALDDDPSSREALADDLQEQQQEEEETIADATARTPLLGQNV